MNNPFAEQITKIFEKELSIIDENLKALEIAALQALLHTNDDAIISIVSALSLIGEKLNSSINDLDLKVSKFALTINAESERADASKEIYRKPILERINRTETILNSIKRAISI